MQELINAQQALQTIEKQDADLTKWFGDIQIQSVTQQKNYEEILGSAKIAYKRAKAVQDSLVNPLESVISNIKALFKPKLDEYSKAITAISGILNQWHTAQKQITEGEVLQRAEDYWKQRKDAEGTGEVVALPDLAVTPVPSTSKHNMGSTNYRPHIKVSIIQPNLIPREYCMPSESLLRKAGDLAQSQGKPMPVINGALLEVEYTPVSRPIK